MSAGVGRSSYLPEGPIRLVVSPSRDRIGAGPMPTEEIMSANNGRGPQPWEAALQFIRALPTDQRRRLLNHLTRSREGMLGYVTIPKQIVEFMESTSLRATRLLYRLARLTGGPQARKIRANKRYEFIEQLLDAGVSDWNEIRRLVGLEDATWLNGRNKGKMTPASLKHQFQIWKNKQTE
jgi:hypothetical protein